MDENAKANQEQPEVVAAAPVAPPPENPMPAQVATEQELRATEQKIEQQIDERMTGFERSMVRLTRYGLAVTILTGIIFAGQLYEMITGGTQTDKLVGYARTQANSAGDQADAAQQFSDTAEDINGRMSDAVDQLEAASANTRLAINKASQDAQRALDVSIEASKLDQRAWFGIYDFEVLQYDPDNPKKPFRIQILFRNSGKTPARQIHALGIFNVFKSKPDGPVDGPTDADWDTFMGFFNKSKERYVTAPNAVRKYIVTDANNNIVTLAYPSIKDHSLFAYYYGQATYIDINERAHTTRFCLLLAEPETKQLAHCGKGNDMD